MQIVPLKCVPSPVRQPLGGSFGRPGGRQFCLSLSQYHPYGQSARFTGWGMVIAEPNPTAAAPRLAATAILRFFISVVLLVFQRVPIRDCAVGCETLLAILSPSTSLNTCTPPALRSTS